MLAKSLNWNILDSGAIYRILAYKIANTEVDFGDEYAIASTATELNFKFQDNGDAIQINLDGQDITKAIRTEVIGELASKISQFQKVRDALVTKQRDFAVAPGLVADGRDMGTKIFPDANLKIFLTAKETLPGSKTVITGNLDGHCKVE